ncbi:MAG: hypothetical protein ACI8TP_003727 [Acidimicrobiales bacterium]|jgi:hypothetical protein
MNKLRNHGRASVVNRSMTLVLGLALVLSSCGGSGSDDSTASTNQASTETSGPVGDAEEGSAPVDSPAEDETVEDETVEEPDSEASDSDCLVGNWVLTEEVMNGWYDTFETGADVTFEITGSTTLDFNDDGTFLYLPEFALSMVTGGIDGTGDTSGSLGGTYTIDEGVVRTETIENDLVIDITVAGIEISSDQFGSEFANVPLSEAPFDCSGPNPVILFETAAGPRYPVELTPA